MATKKTDAPGASATDKWVLAAQRAQRTATWAKTMTKVLISQSNGSQPAWHVVNFLGPNKSEARGIVDLLAIRRNQRAPEAPLKRGDLFEIVLLQVKGGGAKWPSAEDRERLRAVKDAYDAKEVLLSEWKQGARAKLYRLDADDWVELSDPAEVFCPTAKPAARKKAQQLLSVSAAETAKPSGNAPRTKPGKPDSRSIAAKKAWATRRAATGHQ
jgi:hypothetical protein